MHTRVRSCLFTLLGLSALLGGALAVRQIAAPRPVPPPLVDLTTADEVRLRASAAQAVVEDAALLDHLRRAEVVLVGEVHFYEETMQQLARLLERLDDRPISLLLELPAKAQASIDRSLESGDEALLDAVFAQRGVLPYRSLVVWARANRDRVPVVVAMDENRSRVVLNRALLRDTRNETMARHVIEERRRNPGNLVVAYGGQLHLIRAGRYRFDVENRVPMGARLERAGIAPERIVSLMLSGDGEAPICDLLETGAVVSTTGALGNEGYPLFLRGTVFRAETARELFDYFVDLGPLTRTGP